MLKFLFKILLAVLSLILVIGLASAYTAPSFSNTNITMCNSVPPSFSSTNITMGVNDECSAPPIVTACNYTDVMISIWNYPNGKFIDQFGESDKQQTPINTTIGQDIWTYSGDEGRFIDGIGTASNIYTGNEIVANCNVTDIAVAMWNYNGRYITGISSGTPSKVAVNPEIGQAVWNYIGQLRTAQGTSG